MDGTALDGIEAAYRGEIYGEALYEAIAWAQPDPERAWKWRVLAQLERETGAELAACLRRHGRAPRPAPEDRTKGIVDAKIYAALPWQALMRRFAEELDADIAEYSDLARRAGAAEAAVLARLVEHERVTQTFCRRECAGAGDTALAPVLAFVKQIPPR